MRNRIYLWLKNKLEIWVDKSSNDSQWEFRASICRKFKKHFARKEVK